MTPPKYLLRKTYTDRIRGEFLNHPTYTKSNKHWLRIWVEDRWKERKHNPFGGAESIVITFCTTSLHIAYFKYEENERTRFYRMICYHDGKTQLDKKTFTKWNCAMHALPKSEDNIASQRHGMVFICEEMHKEKYSIYTHVDPKMEVYRQFGTLIDEILAYYTDFTNEWFMPIKSKISSSCK